MNGYVVATRAKSILTVLFLTFLVANVVMITMAWMGHLPPHLARESPLGERLGLLIVVCAISYFLAQLLYKFLVVEDVPPSDAVNTSISLLTFLVLIAAIVGFLASGSWLWLPVLFLLLLVWAIFSLWSLLGWLLMILVLALTAAAVALTYFVLN